MRTCLVVIARDEAARIKRLLNSVRPWVDEMLVLDTGSVDATPALAAVIVPSVKEFQFALPADTRAKVFEIWVKYDLSVRDPKGGEIGHWVFTAYGKTPTAFLTSDEAAIHAASVVALRDAGASMITGLQTMPSIA